MQRYGESLTPELLLEYIQSIVDGIDTPYTYGVFDNFLMSKENFKTREWDE